jgi:hypothetical protein
MYYWKYLNINLEIIVFKKDHADLEWKFHRSKVKMGMKL